MAACPVLHVVAEGDVLPLRVDALSTRATSVVEVVPGVPSPTIPTQLYEPRPDLFWRRVDRDGHRRAPLTVGDQVGTGIRPRNFLIGRAPAHEPRAHPGSIDDGCRCRPGHTCDFASECHTTSIGGSAPPHKRPTSRALCPPSATRPQPDRSGHKQRRSVGAAPSARAARLQLPGKQRTKRTLVE